MKYILYIFFQLKCCGSNGPIDYKNSRFGNDSTTDDVSAECAMIAPPPPPLTVKRMISL